MITLSNLDLPSVETAIFKKVAWELWRKNQDVVFFKFGIGPFSITRKVRHLKGPLERLIGPEVFS